MADSIPQPPVPETAPPVTPPDGVTAEGEAFPSAPRRLKYVEVRRPAPGTCVPVAPGLTWCRIPLPMDLDHINVWLLDTDDGCMIVDTGMAASIGKDAWEAIARDVFATRPVRGVFITHIHPDHIGLAAWLQQQHGVPVMMSKRTHEIATLLLGGGERLRPEDAAAFFRSHGVIEQSQIQPMFRPERLARITSGMPEVSRFVAEGEVLTGGADSWTALATDGHAEGHLCLSNANALLLISGDQVLPTISSNISFTWHAGDPNPLQSYLDSLERLRALDAGTLVLPSHGVPFYGLRHRIDDLRRHHAVKLAMLAEACREPKTAVDVLPLMYRRELKGMHLFLALTEALAHLEYLANDGRVERRTTAGVIRYAAP